jgi:hypothetical protein
VSDAVYERPRGGFTRDAGPLYARHGFPAPAEPSGYMEIVDREV